MRDGHGWLMRRAPRTARVDERGRDVIAAARAGAVAAMIVLAPGGQYAAGQAADPDADCGRIIIADTVLTEDIGPCAGIGIIVGADGIMLDLGGHRVFGYPEPSSLDCNGLPSGTVCGSQAGIRVTGRTGVTVTNGMVTGFDAGVFLQGGGGSHTISRMTIRDNLGPDATESYLGDGIYVENSPAAHIVGNTIVNNGVFDGIGLYGVRSAGATVENNTVEDSKGPSASASYGQGIIVNAFVDVADQGKTVPGMRFLNNTVRRSDSAGISNFNHTDGTIAGNIVEDNGLRNFNGNGIAIQLGPGAAPGTRLLVENNQVHGNGWDGIQVGLLATGNQILNNNAANNNAVSRGSFDLHDLNSECAGNLWAGNDWGRGGYAPACTTTGGSGPPPTTVPPATRHPIADFDGDGDSDVSVFRPAQGAWYRQGSPDLSWGTSDDVPVPGDYDGNGSAEIAVFRPSSGTWFVNGGATTNWGTSGDIPVPADYDGDGKADIAVFRAGVWYVTTSGPGPDFTSAWGTTGDIPVPADYTGDGVAEVAVFRPSDGVWYIQGGATTNWGTTGDIPVPADYTGDGIAEVAVFRPSDGVWYIQGGATTNWGTTGDRPLTLPAGIYQSIGTNTL